MIICGTDFSVPSQAAAKAAAALAHKQALRLLLGTVLQPGDVVTHDETERQLTREADELRRAFPVDIQTLVAQGLPDEELLQLTKTHSVRLLVVGAARGDAQSPRLGVVQEHLCQRAEVPVFVVRDASSLISWSQGECALRALVGSGLGDASKSALACVGAWPEVAVTVVHVAWPYGEHYRLGISGPLPHGHLLPEVEQQLLGDLGRWAMDLPCHPTPKLRVTAGWGRIDSHLAHLAKERAADLLVVGTHERNLHEPTWQASTSRSVIQGTTCNVLCVPERYLAQRAPSAPRLIVVPTDFTRLADRAIAFGASLLTKGGSLHLVHVATEASDEARSRCALELQARLPKEASLRGIVNEVRVLHGNPAWLAIGQHAARARADLICMAIHSRETGSSFPLGTQTKALLQHAQIPVLLVPQDRET